MQDNPKRIPVNRKLLTRFFSRVRIDPAVTFKGVPCWLWTGSTLSGYGRFSVKGATENAHRIAFGMFVYVLLPRRYADHLCRNRICVNPVHVDDVTNRINILRGEGMGARNARKTHCIHGHEFTPENTYTCPNTTYRECKTCMELRNERLKQARQLNKQPRKTRTHCKHGHLMRPAGGPYKHRCLICVRENGARARQRKKLRKFNSRSPQSCRTLH